MNKGLLAAVAIIAVLAIGGLVYVNTKNTSTSPSPSTATSPQESSVSSASPSASSAASATVITYKNGAFSPATLTVKSGTVVTIKNDGTSSIQFDSDPHPDHTDNTQLNVGVVKAGESKTFTVTTTGSFGYHNHLVSSQTGMIVVQ